MSTRTDDRAVIDLMLAEDEPRDFDADDFIRVYDRLLDRIGAMSLPFGMGLREAIANGYLPLGTIQDVIAAEWDRRSVCGGHGR